MPDIPHKKIRDMLLQLEQAHSAIAVAVAALKQQNCELDADIAHVLQRGAADRLQEPLESLQQLLER